eukprot:7614682-Ditylum_brightwellii.AAC.1
MLVLKDTEGNLFVDVPSGEGYVLLDPVGQPIWHFYSIAYLRATWLGGRKRVVYCAMVEKRVEFLRSIQAKNMMQQLKEGKDG